MKKFLYAIGVLSMLLCTSVLTSCSDDDGNGDLDTPEYEAYAAKYDITTPGADYQSIELTASGNYIITSDRMNAAYAPAANNAVERKHSSFFTSGIAKSRSYYNGVIYGKYTKISDNEFRLDGFGTIKITSDGNNAFDLDITTNNGQNIVLGANRDNQYSSSTMTDKLCRTWNLNRIEGKLWYNGRLIETVTINQNNYDDYFDDDEFPESVIFTKAGTYMVFYNNSTLAVSTWRWENENNGILRYSWDYDQLYDPDESGTCNISFSGNQLKLIETDEYTEDGDRYKEEMTYFLSESR